MKKSFLIKLISLCFIIASFISCKNDIDGNNGSLSFSIPNSSAKSLFSREARSGSEIKTLSDFTSIQIEVLILNGQNKIASQTADISLDDLNSEGNKINFAFDNLDVSKVYSILANVYAVLDDKKPLIYSGRKDDVSLKPNETTSVIIELKHVVDGDTIVSSDNVLAVTSNSEGLLVNLNLTGKPWKYIYIKVRDETTGIENVYIQTERSPETAFIEALYPFVEKGHEYIVWVTHMDDDWKNWAENKDIAPKVTAKGGFGNFSIHSSGMEYSSTSSTREIIINDFDFVCPESFKNYPYKVDGSIAEVRGRNENTIYPGTFIMQDNKILVSSNEQALEFVRGRSNLKFNFDYKFSYDGWEFSFPLVEEYNNNTLFDDSEILPDKVIWEAADEHSGTFMTTDKDYENLEPIIILENEADLSCYKYLNFELSSPNCGNNGIGLDLGSLNADGSYNKLVTEFGSRLTNQAQTFQTYVYSNINEFSSLSVYDRFDTKLKAIYLYAAAMDLSSEAVKDIEVHINKIVATNTKIGGDTSTDKILYESDSTSQGFKITTKKDEGCRFAFGPNNLQGYKYINVELDSPYEGDCHIYGNAWSFTNQVLEFDEQLHTEPFVIQSAFGTNRGTFIQWDEEQQKNIVKPVVSNYFGSLFLETRDIFTNQPIENVEIYIKKIWATNTKIQRADREIFTASDSNGYKITTGTLETNGSDNNIHIGEIDLADYKYINFELYSPNSGDYVIGIDGWSWGHGVAENERIVDFDSTLTTVPQVYQVHFGTFKGYWSDWDDDGEHQYPVTDNLLTTFALFASDENWQWTPNIDIYIKRIWATNTEI